MFIFSAPRGVGAGFICHMESPMIIWAGCAEARGDFMKL